MKYELFNGILCPIALGDIDLRAARRRKRKVKFLDDPTHDVVGCDSETRRGDIFALGVASQDTYREYTAKRFGDAVDLDVIFEALTDSNLREKLCVWYNIGYDFGCILKHLPRRNIIELREVGEVDYNGLKIRYIEGKGADLRIDKNVYRHRDIAGVFHCSLKKALESWTDIRKLDETVDVEQFGKLAYLKKNRAAILEYLKGDCVGTRELWIQFSKVAQDLGIPCANPWSSGSIAEGHALNRFETTGKGKPRFGPVNIQSECLQSYFGGRFEVIRRGWTPGVKMVDINSAYPAAHAEAIDPGAVVWRRVRATEPQGLQPQGVYRVRAHTSEGPVQPLPVRRRDGIIIFPHGLIEGWYMGVELIASYQAGLFESLEIVTGFEPSITKETRRPYAYLRELYAWRMELKAAGDDAAQQAIKIVINACYGKMIQAVQRKNIRPLEGVTDKMLNKLQRMAHPHDPEAIEWFMNLDLSGRWVASEPVAGSLFSPHTASFITASTRAELINRAAIIGFDNVALFATDSIASTVPKVGPIGDALGEWGLDAEGDALIVGSGVYEVWKDGVAIKTALRGLPKSYFRGKTLRDVALDAVGNTLAISGWAQPLTLREAMARGVDLSHVGRFRNMGKTIRSDFDSKREWGHAATWGDLARSSWPSNPLEISSFRV